MMPEDEPGRRGLIAGITGAIDRGERIPVKVLLNGEVRNGEIVEVDDRNASQLMIGTENLVQYYERVYASIVVPSDDWVVNVSIPGVRIHLSYPLCAVRMRDEAPQPTENIEGFVMIL